MKRSTRDQRPLLDPWLDWQQLPDAVRQHALDVLTALYLVTVDSPNSETQDDESSSG
jgi:hypothetical protein